MLLERGRLRLPRNPSYALTRSRGVPTIRDMTFEDHRAHEEAFRQRSGLARSSVGSLCSASRTEILPLCLAFGSTKPFESTATAFCRSCAYYAPGWGIARVVCSPSLAARDRASGPRSPRRTHAETAAPCSKRAPLVEPLVAFAIFAAIEAVLTLAKYAGGRARDRFSRFAF